MTKPRDIRTKESGLAFRDLRFPVIARSTPAGWLLDARTLDELISSQGPFDPADWQGLEIFDYAGRYFLARRVFRAGDAGVDAELVEKADVPLEELQHQVVCLAILAKRPGHLLQIRQARNLKDLVHALFDGRST